MSLAILSLLIRKSVMNIVETTIGPSTKQICTVSVHRESFLFALRRPQVLGMRLRFLLSFVPARTGGPVMAIDVVGADMWQCKMC